LLKPIHSDSQSRICQDGHCNFFFATGHLELSDLSFNNANENIFSSSIVEHLLPRCNLQLQCVRYLDIAGLLKWQTAVRIGDFGNRAS